MRLIPAVIFLSAFLLFQVQPLLGKSLLPWFGGTAGVWTVSMLFFQTGLLAGYAYAHLLIRHARPWTQAAVHLGVLAAAVLTLPVLPSPAWKPSGAEDPTWRLLAILAVSAGLPYFALASTSPLLQSWSSRSRRSSSPYPLFALSNLGSFAALLSYPFMVEPFLTVSAQAWWWSGAFVVQAIGCGAVAIGSASLRPREEAPAVNTGPAPRLRAYLLWLLQSAAGTILFLEVTNYLCLEVAVVPLLWVVPLALYLLSFVLAFDRDRWYSRRTWLGALFAAAVVAAGAQVLLPHATLLLIAGWSAVLFAGCMLCHGELALSRPDPAFLTGFYLTAAAGGALGGVLVGLVATRVFADYLDLPLGLLLPLLVVALGLRERDRAGRPAARRMSAVVVALALTALVIVPPLFGAATRNRAIARARNFFGVVRVTASSGTRDAMLSLFNGHTLHGSQFRSAERRRTPTAYYGRTGGAGRLLDHFRAGRPRRIGVLGLGVGTLAAYGAPGDTIRFYEINPEVVRFAHEHFTWLRDSAATVSVALGDARIVLDREPGRNFDILVADVYSGGTIPVHLFTTEAFATYLRHLAPHGVLALHVSNSHLDLAPLAFAMARHFQLAAGLIDDPGDRANGALASRYVLLSRDPAFLALPGIREALDPPGALEPMEPWTDSENSLMQALVW